MSGVPLFLDNKERSELEALRSGARMLGLYLNSIGQLEVKDGMVPLAIFGDLHLIIVGMIENANRARKGTDAKI